MGYFRVNERSAEQADPAKTRSLSRPGQDLVREKATRLQDNELDLGIERPKIVRV